MSIQKLTLSIVSFTVLIANLTFADWKENAKVIKVSGGEDHVLVLTANKWPWGCGANYAYQLGIGDATDDQSTLIRVHGGDMATASGYLENINDIAAGWARSFACGASEGMSQAMAGGFAQAEVISSVSAVREVENVETVKIEQIIKWLDEIWLDPEVRKSIDEDTWLKFIESLKEEL
jgi:hypothetical protein